MEALEILEIYNRRFKIEFLFLDAKEYTGLTSSSINIAKVANWYNLPKDQRNTFSMKNIKINHHNIA